MSFFLNKFTLNPFCIMFWLLLFFVFFGGGGLSVTSTPPLPWIINSCLYLQDYSHYKIKAKTPHPASTLSILWHMMFIVRRISLAFYIDELRHVLLRILKGTVWKWTFIFSLIVKLQSKHLTTVRSIQSLSLGLPPISNNTGWMQQCSVAVGVGKKKGDWR
jgi:hypothetical protein